MYLESTEQATTSVSIASNSSIRSLKARISVGHTKVRVVWRMKEGREEGREDGREEGREVKGWEGMGEGGRKKGRWRKREEGGRG